MQTGLKLCLWQLIKFLQQLRLPKLEKSDRPKHPLKVYEVVGLVVAGEELVEQLAKGELVVVEGEKDPTRTISVHFQFRFEPKLVNCDN